MHLIRTTSRIWIATLIFISNVAIAQVSTAIESIEILRLKGELNEALIVAEQQLENPNLAIASEIALLLETARIHDRIGLHQNSRPVAAALASINAANSLALQGDATDKAAVELAKADYYYRAEMQAREFPVAESHALLAIELFRGLNDGHGEADAVHRLGLVELQRGNLQKARQLFEESKRIDVAAGERVFFTGEYERHVGFVFQMAGDKSASLPYFERSLEARRKAGAVDASIFAAISLGGVLVDLERFDEAETHLLYAVRLAEQMNSPVATARAQIAMGRMYSSKGDYAAARLAFSTCIAAADSVNLTTTARQAREALDSL